MLSVITGHATDLRVTKLCQLTTQEYCII